MVNNISLPWKRLQRQKIVGVPVHESRNLDYNKKGIKVLVYYAAIIHTTRHQFLYLLTVELPMCIYSRTTYVYKLKIKICIKIEF